MFGLYGVKKDIIERIIKPMVFTKTGDMFNIRPLR